MPHGAKQNTRSTNNKKKKKNNNSIRHQQQSGASRVTSSSASSSSFSSSNTSAAASGSFPRSTTSQYPQNIHITPWQDSVASPSKQIHQNGLYDLYKIATERFKAGLAALCPENFMKKDTVQVLMDAAEHVREKYSADMTTTTKVPFSVIQDLTTAIKIRRRVSLTYFKDSDDDGHAFFLGALIYCYAMLKPLAAATTERTDISHDKNIKIGQQDRRGNRFHALNTELDEGDEKEEEDWDLPEIPLQRPTEPSTERSYSIAEDLIKGSDRFRACLFLQDINDLAGGVSHVFRALKSKVRAIRQSEDLDSYALPLMMEDLIEAAVACSLATQQVHYLQAKFIQENPNICSIYRILALVALPNLMQELDEMVLSKSPAHDRITNNEMVGFIGDCLEATFRNASDPHNRLPQLIEQHAKQWQVSVNDLSNIVSMIRMLALTEAPLAPERKMNRLIAGLSRLQPHTWLRAWPFLAGKTSLLHTLRLLQGISGAHQKESKLVLKRGFFGRQWDETSKKANQIPFDLDEFLMGDVLPDLLFACTHGILSKELPREFELMPLVPLLRKWIDNKDKAVPVSLCFAVQCLLISVYELQGDGDVEFLARSAKKSVDLFDKQINEKFILDLPNTPAWRHNIAMMQLILLNLTKAIGPNTVEARSYWNPYCAGMFLSYITYYVNLEGGCAVVDSISQLRIVLHLFHAAKERGLVEDELPLMERLFEAFRPCKAVWQGPLPKQGEFAKRFLISFGLSVKEAQRFADTSGAMLREQRPRSSARQLSPIAPEELSKSFRQICLRDFSLVEDLYHTEEQKLRTKGHYMHDFAVRYNDTLDAIEKEQKNLLSMNLIACGALLNQFVYSLANILQWRPLLEEWSSTLPAMAAQGGRVRLNGGRSVAADSWNNSKENCVIYMTSMMVGTMLLTEFDRPGPIPNGSIAFGASMWIAKFFSMLSPTRVLFFLPSEIEEETEDGEIVDESNVQLFYLGN